MDLNDVRALFTVVMLVIFVGIFIWAWSSKRKEAFSEAAQLPLSEPEYPRADNNKGGTL